MEVAAMRCGNGMWGGGSGSEDPRYWVRLNLPGWSEHTPTEDLRIWHDSEGDVLSLGISAKDVSPPEDCDEMTLRRWCRALAESRGGGLIEARAVTTWIGPSVSLIYKRLQEHACIYTGMLITSVQGRSLVWTIVKGERGTTGLRAAAVFATLLQAGKLTIDDFERRWAEDPYEPAYKGVDRSVLRNLADDESYDEKFPWHPLSKVRRLLAALPGNVQLVAQPAGDL
jgi:hypothetical protein